MLWTKGRGSRSSSCWQNPAFIISSLATVIYPACQVTEDIARTICFPLPESSHAVWLHVQDHLTSTAHISSVCLHHLWQDFFPWVGIFTSHLLIWLASFSDINCLASSKPLLLSFPSILEGVTFITSLLISSFFGAKRCGFNLLRSSLCPPTSPARGLSSGSLVFLHGGLKQPVLLADMPNPLRTTLPSGLPKTQGCVRGPARFQSLRDFPTELRLSPSTLAMTHMSFDLFPLLFPLAASCVMSPYFFFFFSSLEKPWQWVWIGRGRSFANIWGHLRWSWLGAKGGIASGIYWTEASGAAKYPAMHRTATHDKELAKMSVVLRLRNPALARPTSVELPACTALCCAPFFFAQWPLLSSASLSPTVGLLMSNHPSRLGTRIALFWFLDHAQYLEPLFWAFSDSKISGKVYL